MLTAIEIENFKGIGARQRIDFAPLTLLFGANSAGKSTILQALLYLQELIERGAADVDRTDLGGNVVDLGGFARLVHKHETDRAIVLRAEFATPISLNRFGRDLTETFFPEFDDEVDTAWLELTIRSRTTATFHGPIVERATIGINGESQPLAWLEIGATLREGEPLLTRMNFGHPLLAHLEELWEESWKEIALPGTGVSPVDGTLKDGRYVPVFAVARDRSSALPSFREPLRVVVPGDIEGDKEALVRLSIDRGWRDENGGYGIEPVSEETARQRAALRSSINTRQARADDMRAFLEMVVLGTTAQLASFLRDAQYLGPLRTVPPRGFLYERAGRTTSWADGLAAWDGLLADRLTLIERTNAWLRKLGAGCQVVVQELFERGADAEDISDGHVDKTVRRLLLDTGAGSLVLPSEVGAGISQIIPVVVAALERRGGLCMIEQPEIHVHPAVQVGLGDLFIEATSADAGRRMMLVETHSEHLILRLLRRIRESTEGEHSDRATPFSADKLSVMYVEGSAEGVRIRRLRVDEHGEFVDRWPKGFFAERAEELF